MNKKLLILIMIFLILSIVYAQENLREFVIEENSIREDNKVLLKSRQFIPQRGVSETAKAKIKNKEHVLIQFNDIPTKEEKKELEKKGIKLLSYIPNKAWFASVSGDIGEIEKISIVRAIDETLPEDKIFHIKKHGVPEWARNDDGTVNLTIMFFKDVSLQKANEIISNYGEIIGTSKLVNALIVRVPETSITELAKNDEIQWIEPNKPEPREFNDGVRAAISVNVVQDSPYNLDGTGVVAAEWDGGWVDSTHDDLQGRVTIGDTGSSVISHATHVAGTMLGNGNLSAAKGGTALQWRGMATKATVISYEWWNDIIELESEYTATISTYNADISQNSWGIGPGTITIANCEAVLGNYFTENSALDDVVIGKLGKKVSIMWAAGNDRSTSPQSCGSLGFTYRTVSPYGTSKNTITVGATNSNDDSMTSFSSWGPTDDGRLKPDIVAPGCQSGGDGGVTSTVPGDAYNTFCGTSMATPAVSGSVALILQDYRSMHSNNDPLPSTIKALLAQTAKDLGRTGPDFEFGYGRINVTSAINLIRSDTNANDVIIEKNIVEQDSKDVYSLTVSGQTQLKITLAWDDEPGMPNAAKELVNNLDLRLIAPDGTIHFPWLLDPNNPSIAATTGIDSVNNIEQVYVNNPSSGTWQVEVIGTAVPIAPQKYSLVSTNHLSVLQFGSLQPYLINPITNKNVSKNEFFNFSSGVKCVGGVCGNVTATLDPETEISYDDGGAEGFVRFSSSPGGGLAVRFTPSTYPVKIKTARFFVDTLKSFELHVWDDDGIGNIPKSNLITPFTATPPVADTWFDIDLSSYNITINDGDFYIGWIETWATSGPPPRVNNLGFDENVPHDVRSWVFDRSSWFSLSDLGSPWNIRDLMIRTVVVSEAGKGVIPINSGTPFYTLSNNPQTCINMQNGDTCNQTWQVNATGSINKTYEFFTIYEPTTYAPYIASNKTKKINITIVEAIPSGLLISITLLGFPVDFSNLEPNTANSSAIGNINNSYIIRIDSITTVNVDIFKKGNNFTKGADILDIKNVVYDDDKILEGSLDITNPETILTNNYGVTPYFSNVIPGTNKSIYYFISIPQSQRAGDYSTTFYIKAVETGALP